MACQSVGRVNWLIWSVFQYQKQEPGDDALRKRLRELANERRRFGYRRLGILCWPERALK